MIFIYCIICIWLGWVFAVAGGLSLVAAGGSCVHSLLTVVDPRRRAQVLARWGFSSCGILVTAGHVGSNSCPLHWQTDSHPLHHQGPPKVFISLLICYTDAHICIFSKMLILSVQNCTHKM